MPNPERDAGLLKAHPKWRNRMFAAERLGISKSKEAVPDLIEALKSDEDLFVRNAAAQSLGQIRDPRAIEPLISAMLRDIAVREQASKALAAINGSIVETRLMSLARDKDPIARGYALDALALMNTDGHLSAFFEESMKDSSPSVRHRAAEALRASTSSADQPTDPLVRLLRSTDPVVRAYAVEDMGLAQEPAYAPFLIEAAQKDSQEEVRQNACVALGRIGTDEATDALIRFLDDPKAPTRAVLRGLAYTKKERAAEPIIAAYEREGFPREEAIGALAEIGGPKATDFLKGRLKAERGSVRRLILDALADMKDKAAVEALIAAFESDTDNQIRIIKALESIGGEEVMRFMARKAVDTNANPASRSAALRALETEGSEAAADLIREAALSRRPAVAQAARDAMEALGIAPTLKPPEPEDTYPPRFKPPPP
jgi:HEAT repeat protein